MIFLADENIDKPIVEVLRKTGYKVDYVQEMSPGIADEEVLHMVEANKAILITCDKDFGELVFRMNKSPYGVILIRLAGLPQSLKAKLLLNAIENHFNELENNFTIISPDNIRIRKIPDIKDT